MILNSIDLFKLDNVNSLKVKIQIQNLKLIKFKMNLKQINCKLLINNHNSVWENFENQQLTFELWIKLKFKVGNVS